MHRWAWFGLTLAACLTLFTLDDRSWALEDCLDQGDLAERTHPDIFRWKWDSSAPQPTPSTEVQEATSRPQEGEEGIQARQTGDGLPIPLDQLDNSLVQRVFFDYDRSDILEKSRRGIEINTEWFKNHPEYDILLEGHCDERGSNEYNLALGERRARAVLQVMTELGIAPNRISIRSWGEEKPLDLHETEKAFALNRRVEFYAIPK